jgi:hypothetical protein
MQDNARQCKKKQQSIGVVCSLLVEERGMMYVWYIVNMRAVSTSVYVLYNAKLILVRQKPVDVAGRSWFSNHMEHGKLDSLLIVQTQCLLLASCFVMNSLFVALAAVAYSLKLCASHCHDQLRQVSTVYTYFMNFSSSLLPAFIGGPFALSSGFFPPPRPKYPPTKAVPRVAMASYDVQMSESEA